MKERIKKFYEDHKEAVWVGSSILAVAMIRGSITKRQLVKANTVVGTAVVESPNQPTQIWVYQRNGEVNAFTDGPFKV